LIDRTSRPATIPIRVPEERVAAIDGLRRLRMTGAQIAEAFDMPLSTTPPGWLPLDRGEEALRRGVGPRAVGPDPDVPEPQEPTGRRVDEAPLASEAPEMIIAILFTLRLKAQAGLGTLISSKVNQWTLLVGTQPLVFALGGGDGGGFLNPMDLDGRQIEEVFLTAAQSLFAVAVVASLSLSVREAVGLMVLFFGQFFVPIPAVRIGFGIGYIVLALGIFAFSRESRESLVDSVIHVYRRGRRGRRA
jgi:hypothetical protein